MRVLVNQLAAGTQKTGIGHYTNELIRCLRALPGDHRVTEYHHAFFETLRSFWGKLTRRPGPLPSGPPGTATGGMTKRFKGFVLERLRPLAHRLLRQYARRAYTHRHYDLYHEPNFIVLPCQLPTVVTVHDLSAVLHPEWHPPDRVARFEQYFHRGLSQAQHFLAISESARQEIIRTLGIAPERITRTYMGIRPGLGPLPPEEVAPVLKRLGLPARYLLYLGTIEPRKNVLRLLQAYCSLPAPVRERWPLVLAGGWGWRTREVADYFHEQARHRGVLHLGYLPDADVPAVYNGARALVFPSLYEGFGLPPVEMMACGGAVLASSIGPHVETVGRRACLIAPDDLDGWRAALLRVVEDDDWWAELRRGAQEIARPFTWEQCARDTLRVYRAIAGISSSFPTAA